MFAYDLPDELVYLCDPEGGSQRYKRIWSNFQEPEITL